MLCAKTFHKVAGRVDAPVKGVADQEVKVAKAAVAVRYLSPDSLQVKNSFHT